MNLDNMFCNQVGSASRSNYACLADMTYTQHTA